MHTSRTGAEHALTGSGAAWTAFCEDDTLIGTWKIDDPLVDTLKKRALEGSLVPPRLSLPQSEEQEYPRSAPQSAQAQSAAGFALEFVPLEFCIFTCS